MHHHHQVVRDTVSKPGTGDDDFESLPSNEHEHEQVEPNDYAPKQDGAPRYAVPPRAMGAVEVPMIVADVDRATRAFGNVGSFQTVSPSHFLSCEPNIAEPFS